MHLKMKISMGGPAISVVDGQELPFDDDFPFTANEVHRFRAAEIAELIGTDEEIAAWLKANPADEPVEPAIDAEPAADPAPKAAAAKAVAKKG